MKYFALSKVIIDIGGIKQLHYTVDPRYLDLGYLE